MKPLVHPRTLAALEAITTAGASSYIFHGSRSSGKYMAALWLAAKLNCPAGGDDDCSICRQITAGNFPDLIITDPDEKAGITIDQIRKLLSALTLSSYRPSGTRIVIIDEAQSISSEAQNVLLKSLEEPPENTRFILITPSIEALLPTVRSRLSAIYFAPVLSSATAALLEQQLHLKPSDALAFAEQASGVVGTALILATDPKAESHQAKLDETASKLLSASPFERLIAVQKFTADKTPPDDLLRLVQYRITADITAGIHLESAASRMTAVSNARRLLGAGVLSRVVLDRLTTEL